MPWTKCETCNLFYFLFSSKTTQTQKKPKSSFRQKQNDSSTNCQCITTIQRASVHLTLETISIAGPSQHQRAFLLHVTSGHSSSIHISVEEKRPHVGHGVHSEIVGVHLLAASRKFDIEFFPEKPHEQLVQKAVIMHPALGHMTNRIIHPHSLLFDRNVK
jgi:hypothetical protein